ncbi:PREDICTED: armadillo repeat-containing protein 6 homolog [Papilio xuthus]|uniref:Armadillo repeat-containing protein 6 homolog n=1 Tax=Papilio xuthus TaxID=66420 RepID=A0AAJ6ZBD0_PAPXU|nr:PREDICTED: armadillo repeat-containing protein 6 homolog [Papilio xuthus]
MRECNKDIAHRVRAGKEGIYPALINLLDLKQKSYLNVNNEKDAASIIKVINTLIALMNSQPDLLDRKGVEIIKKNLDEIEDESILIATLKWTAVCCVKHEMNRQMIFGAGIGWNSNNLLNKTNNIELISECLQVIRKLTLDDDVRVEFGKAHEHARELGAELLDTLTRLLENNMKPPLVSDVMCTIACLLVRHELCAVAAERGAAALFTVLADNYDDVTVVHQATKLITALAGNDDVKRQLVKSGIVPIIVSLLSRFASNATVTAQTLRCMSALALREPAHGRLLLDCGAAEPLLHCLKMHPRNAALQKNGCWAIRNMVARCRDYNSKFKELGIEDILNQTYAIFSQDFGFDIKSALRDLDCDVKLDEQWTGKGVQMTN